jgi:serine/threonine protein kinase
LEVVESQTERLPQAEKLYLELPNAAEGGGSILRADRLLHPLAVYDSDTGEVFFINSRKGRNRAEYLGYNSGDDRRELLESDQRELLARVLRISVAAQNLTDWAASSHTDDGVHDTEPSATSVRKRLGEFELISKIGEGGMGVVYRAIQPSLGRQVAVKKLLHTGDEKSQARFTREIRALGRVDHPHVVKVYSSGADGEDRFFAMEFIEGADLGAVCEKLSGRAASEIQACDWRSAITTACEAARTKEVPLSTASESAPVRKPVAHHRDAASGRAMLSSKSYIDNVVEVVRQVAGAAHALHEAGIVHRDIKPGNIILTPDGQAVLMDLGLAQLADDAEGRITRTRQFIGTLRYASPEQVLAADKLDCRADVYSLGATLWELLTLQPLFGANNQMPTPELMRRIQRTDPDLPRKYNRSIPFDLQAVVMKCLEKDESRRYQTAAALADDLARWQKSESVAARPPTLPYLLSRFVRQHWQQTKLAMALIIAVVATVVALAVGVRARQPPLARFADYSRPAAVRIAAFDQLDLSSAPTLLKVVSILTEELESRHRTDEVVVNHALSRFVEVLKNATDAESRNQSDADSTQEREDASPARSRVCELLVMLFKNGTWRTRHTAFEQYCILVPPAAVLETIRTSPPDREFQAQWNETHGNYIDALDLDGLDELERLECVRGLIRLLDHPANSIIAAHGSSRLDAFPVRQLTTWLLDFWKFPEYDIFADNSVETYVRYETGTRMARVRETADDLIARLNELFHKIREHDDWELLSLHEAVFLINSLGLVSEAAKYPLPDGARLLSELLNESISHELPDDVLRNVVETFIQLNRQLPRPARSDISPLRTILERDLRRRSAAMVAATKAVGLLDDRKSIERLLAIAGSSANADVSLRAAAVTSLGELALACRDNSDDAILFERLKTFLSEIVELPAGHHHTVVRAALAHFGRIAGIQRASLVFPLLLNADTNLAATRAMGEFFEAARNQEEVQSIVNVYLQWRIGVNEWNANLASPDLSIVGPTFLNGMNSQPPDRLRLKSEIAQALIRAREDRHSSPEVMRLAETLLLQLEERQKQ